MLLLYNILSFRTKQIKKRLELRIKCINQIIISKCRFTRFITTQTTTSTQPKCPSPPSTSSTFLWTPACKIIQPSKILTILSPIRIPNLQMMTKKWHIITVRQALNHALFQSKHLWNLNNRSRKQLNILQKYKNMRMNVTITMIC